MVSAAKAFASEPPRRPLTDFSAICEDFQWRYVDRKKTDQVIIFCRKAPSFEDAVRRAVESRDENGKHHNHQSKVDIVARRTLGKLIVAKKREIKRIKKTLLSDDQALYARFDALHDLIDDIKPYGIGPVTVYDVAVRVGAYHGIEPQSVYMHAGVRQGIRALEAAHSRWVLGDNPGPGPGRALADLRGAARLKRVPMYLFPEPLNKMRADDVEDILCTYREVFDTWHN